MPVIDDVDPGALADASPSCPPSRRCGTRSPPAPRSSASGDKLLGGPRAGLLVGRREAVERCRSHPLARALRIDKLSLAALEATLQLYREAGRDAAAAIPVLAMLTAGEDELARRAQSMGSQLAGSGVGARVIHAAAKAGGGALPLLELVGPVCAVDPGEVALDSLTKRLRQGEPPVIGRRREGRLLLDPRTLTDAQARRAAEAVSAALHG